MIARPAKSALLLSALCCCLPAASRAEMGWFLGAGIGVSLNQDYDCLACGSIDRQDDSGAGGRFFVGYNFNPNFSLTGGYVSLADTKASGIFNDKLSVDGWTLGMRGLLPLSNRSTAFASLGMFNWNQKVNYSSVPFNGSGSFDGTDLMYGMGFSYDIGKHNRIKLEAEWTRYQDVGTNDPSLGHLDDYDLFSFNVIYEFGR